MYSQEKVTLILDLADLLRGAYKRNEYQKSYSRDTGTD